MLAIRYYIFYNRIIENKALSNLIPVEVNKVNVKVFQSFLQWNDTKSSSKYSLKSNALFTAYSEFLKSLPVEPRKL